MTPRHLPRIAPLGREGGYTVAEMMIALVMFGIVGIVFANALISVQGSVEKEQDRTRTNDQARLALEELDREVRSGSVLYDPASENSANCGGYTCQPYYALRVYTQANGNTRTPSTQCVQWIIQNGRLLRRAWASGSGASIDGWRVVADGIVNRDVSPAVPAFKLDPGSGGKVLDVTLAVNADSAHSKTIQLKASFATRNYPTGDPCSPIPAS